MAGDIFNIRDESNIERLVGTIHDPLATPGDVLTVQADGSIAAAAGGGGGGVQVVTVPVSSAQILDLANTPVTLAAVPAGSAATVTAVLLVYVAGLVPYLDGGGNISVTIAPLGANVEALNLVSAGFWDQPASQAQGQPYANGVISNAAVAVDGEDVVLLAANNPTLGDGTLLVTLSYFLAPVA